VTTEHTFAMRAVTLLVLVAVIAMLVVAQRGDPP
jgi:hypothetical protein